MATSKLVRILHEKGLVTESDIGQCEMDAQKRNVPIVQVLMERKIVTEKDVTRVLAEASDVPFVDIETAAVDPGAVILLDGSHARRLKALPYKFLGDNVVVAVGGHPKDLTTRDDLRTLLKRNLILELAPATALNARIEKVYIQTPELDEIADEIDDELQESAVTVKVEEESDSSPIVKYVNGILQRAVMSRASDIHFDPTEKNVVVKFRIDGVLHDEVETGRSFLPRIVSRIKIMADLDIGEKRIPQDGRIGMVIAGKKIDLRVATLPVLHGEKVVMRIIDNSNAPESLDSVGMAPHHQEMYAEQFTKPYGMILATGPTGSGKSTTLYATLAELKSPEINIITVEDPVEFRVPGIQQMQINKKAGLTFSVALRSILRADPDVLLVGEIRDTETAKIAVESALTGHLVLSTLHTNDAPSAVTRLVEMGIEPFLVGSAMNAVVAQRLLRRVCSNCSTDYQLDEGTVERLKFPWDGSNLPAVKQAKVGGCDQCARTGYRGRAAIREMLIVNEEIERIINEGAHSNQIRDVAMESYGMKVMRQDGWDLVNSGATTIAEVLRVSS